MDHTELSPKEKWDGRYGAAGYEPDKSPIPLLVESIAAIPPGRALCLAAGCGRNAVYLAQRGFEVTAVDISPRGLERCRQLAADVGVRVDTVEADLLSYDLSREAFDLITNFCYYEPKVFAPVKEAVISGGFFLLQTYSIHHRRAGRTWGPQSARHLADPPLVLEAFRDWRIRLFGDLDVIQSGDDGGRTDSLVRLLAQKPAD